jgi:hypothetical protein
MAKSLFMRIILFSLLLLAFEQLGATSPVIGTTTFNNNFSGTANLLASQLSPGSVANVGNTSETTGILASGWDFTITVPGANVSMSASAAGANPTGASDFCIRMNSLTVGVTVQTTSVKSNDGSHFGLLSVFLKLNITAGAPADMIITGYRSGSAVTGATKTVTGIATATWTQIDVSTIPEFQDVDEFRFTQAGSTTATISFEVVDQIAITTQRSLPLTLIDFSALHSNGNAVLQWTTASEQNTSGFEIQRSDKNSGFATIGRLPAARQSERNRQYSYTDVLPAAEAPAWFYRLKMVDLDGAFTYSPVLKFNTTGFGPTLSAWPNPFHQQLTVTLEAEAAERSRLTIRDLSGKLLIGQDLPLQKGTNSIPLSSLSRLAKGVYLLTITTSRGQQTLSVLKSD